MLTEEKDILLRFIYIWHTSLYQIYISSVYSPAQIIRVIKKYQQRLYWIRIGMNVYKTPYGYFALRNRKEQLYTTNAKHMYWRDIPTDFKQETAIKINEPYNDITKRSLISISGMESSQ